MDRVANTLFIVHRASRRLSSVHADAGLSQGVRTEGQSISRLRSRSAGVIGTGAYNGAVAIFKAGGKARWSEAVPAILMPFSAMQQRTAAAISGLRVIAKTRLDDPQTASPPTVASSAQNRSWRTRPCATPGQRGSPPLSLSPRRMARCCRQSAVSPRAHGLTNASWQLVHEESNSWGPKTIAQR